MSGCRSLAMHRFRWRKFKAPSSRRRNRLCENSSPAGDPGKTTSTVSIWRVFFGGEGSENPFFVLPKCHFGVFAQPGITAAATANIFQKHVASQFLFSIFRSSCPRRESGTFKPLTENCSLYGWTTHSHSIEGL